ncbi:MAG: membrane-binding protein [Bacteroidales bacterium]|jgi:hypothetical protein|nr:membrane-binding protein [Bacteroidales bacterium]
MSIFRKSDADFISEARIMIDALNRIGSASEDYPMGLGRTFVEEFTALREKVVTYTSERDKLNAELTAKTMQLDDEMKKMKKLYSEAKERVKQDVPQEQWEQFGIDDKK